MKVSLHLGAHKTASTFLQEVLERNAAMLADRGRLAPSATGFRRHVTNVLRRADRGGATGPAAAWLDEVLGRQGVERVILSDENLIGAPPEMLYAGRPYPVPSRLLGRLAPMLAGHEVDLFLSIRQQGEFARSVFCEALRARLPEFVPPERFAAAWAAEPRSWLPLIGAIRSLFPDSPLTIWDFRLVRTGAQQILNAIADLDPPAAFETRGAYRRHSISHDATVALLEIGARDGVAEMYRRKDEVARAHRRNPENRSYRMWDRASADVFREAFDRDLEALRAMGPGIRLLA